MSLFDFGLTWEEPDVWDVFPAIELRVYDRSSSYFACWDFGSCLTSYWPKPPNPDCHWNFAPRYVPGGDSLRVIR